MDISIILCTARSDFPIIGMPTTHVLEPTFRSLERQNFSGTWELIIVDALFPEKQKWIEKREWNFPVKYVPPHPNHRFWLNRKRWSVCGQLNTGLLYVEGELIVRIDDCSQFDRDFLAKFWREYQNGYFPMAMHIRFLEGKPAKLNKEYLEKGYELKKDFLYQTMEPERKEVLKQVYGEEGLVRDSRYPIVKQHGGRMIAPHNWGYGYTSFSLEAALKVNGFDENFDGDKSLEDVDALSRMYMAGYKDVGLLDVNLQVIEHEHKPISEQVLDKNIKPIKCNYALYLLNRQKSRWRANSDKLSEEDLKFIRQESLKPPCSPASHYYDHDCKGELFKLWSQHQPIFDLREERLNV